MSPFFPYVQLSFPPFSFSSMGLLPSFFSMRAILEVIWSYVWAFGKYGSYMELRFFWGSARVSVESYFLEGVHFRVHVSFRGNICSVLGG